MTTPPKKPITSFDTANTVKSQDRDLASETGRSCLWRGFTVGVWGALVVVLLVIGFRLWFLARIDPTRRADLDRFETKIVALPPEWQTAAKVPPDELMKFQRDFYKEVQRLTD